MNKMMMISRCVSRGEAEVPDISRFRELEAGVTRDEIRFMDCNSSVRPRATFPYFLSSPGHLIYVTSALGPADATAQREVNPPLGEQHRESRVDIYLDTAQRLPVHYIDKQGPDRILKTTWIAFSFVDLLELLLQAFQHSTASHDRYTVLRSYSLFTRHEFRSTSYGVGVTTRSCPGGPCQLYE